MDKPKPISDERLAEIEALLEGSSSYSRCSPNSTRELIDEVKRLRAELAEYRALADCDENDDDPMEPWEVVEALERITKKHKEAADGS